MSRADGLDRHLRVVLHIITAFLGLQFLAGMILNTYVTLPAYSASSLLKGMASQPWLLVHVVLGIVSFLSAIVAVIITIRGRLPLDVIILNSLSAASILAAGIFGLEFLMSQRPIDSLAMALFWLISFGFVGFSQSSIRTATGRQRIKNP
ncbi:MAG: hypothetical protein M1113_01575 [Candidatus Thermoplasmatota archaeon]|nr:hypothetical protein [Candidatus Thermoplasmatota archaeon]